MNILYLHDEARGNGYGRCLVNEWEKQMRKAGYKIVMTSIVSEESSQHVYVKLGYKAIGGFLLPLYDNEVVITEIVADEIEKGIGDTVTLSAEGKTADFIISGLYQSTSDAGRCFALSAEGAERVHKMPLVYGDLLLEDKEQAEASIEQVTTIKYGLNSITLLIYVISIIFTIVVVQMVGSRLFLKEKQDLGIMKAVGFTTRTLRLQFAVRFLLIAVIGAGLGIGISILFNDQMFSILFRIIGISSYVTEYSLFSIGVPFAVICCCCFLFAYLSSRKMKRLEVRELIVE